MRTLRFREVGHSFIVRTRTQGSNPGLGWDAGVSLGLQCPLCWPLVGRLGALTQLVKSLPLVNLQAFTNALLMRYRRGSCARQGAGFMGPVL